MKRFLSVAAFNLICTALVFGQSKIDITKPYLTSGGEIMFSFANVEQNDSSRRSIVRFSPVVNLQIMLNKDMNEKFGVFTGLAVRNVGYITDEYRDPTNHLVYKKKFRTYNLAIPAGFKVGNLSKTFFYAGYEAELAITYKEKTFDGGDKEDKITGWFSDRCEMFQHGFLGGIQFPHAVNLKFKYYLSEFHNQDYTTNGNVKPYAGLKTNIMYVSLSLFLFKNLKPNYK